MQANNKGTLPQDMSKEGQHKQNNAVMQKHAVVLDAREQVALLRHSAADWAGSHGRTS